MSQDPTRIALVTGAARRIGRVIASDLAVHGWTVAVHCHRSTAEGEQLVAEIEAAGGRAAVVAADLMDETATQGLLDRVAERLGPVRLLVNNASVFEHDDPATADKASWDRHMTVNLRAPLVLTQALARQLPDGVEGNVVNIVDQRVLNLTPDFTTYTLSKAGLWTLTRTLAQALAPRIRVNAIGPGPVMPSTRQSEADFARQYRALPLARRTAPEEIARAVRFALDVPSMTGQIITLDGGQHLGWAHCPDAAAIKE